MQASELQPGQEFRFDDGNVKCICLKSQRVSSYVSYFVPETWEAGTCHSSTLVHVWDDEPQPVKYDQCEILRKRFVDIVPGLISKSWEDIWERVRELVRSQGNTPASSQPNDADVSIAMQVKAPNVREKFRREVASMDRVELMSRVIKQADWVHAYHTCLDGLGLKFMEPLGPRDIRRIVEALLAKENDSPNALLAIAGGKEDLSSNISLTADRLRQILGALDEREAAQARVAELEQAIKTALATASGREDEWGERAVQCFDILRKSIGKDSMIEATKAANEEFDARGNFIAHWRQER